MSSPEPARHALYARLEEVLGPEHAETLMTHLPSQAAGDLATKADIVRLEGRFDRLEEHFHELAADVRGMHGVMRDQLRTYTLTTIGAMTALTGRSPRSSPSSTSPNGAGKGHVELDAHRAAQPGARVHLGGARVQLLRR